VSSEGESKLDPGNAAANEPPSSPGWRLAGYLLGVLSMSLPPVLSYWFVAPVIPLLVAGACVVVGSITMDRRWNVAAAGAAAAAAFGAATLVVLTLGLAILG
jgi:hypothetical protein